MMAVPARLVDPEGNTFGLTMRLSALRKKSILLHMSKARR
jgi:hypothetical protein